MTLASLGRRGSASPRSQPGWTVWPRYCRDPPPRRRFAVGFHITSSTSSSANSRRARRSRGERLVNFASPRSAFSPVRSRDVVFHGSANAFTQLLGVPPASETDETLGEREIRRALARSGAEELDASEVDVIERVFDLDDTVVREVVVPRPDVVSVPADATMSDTGRSFSTKDTPAIRWSTPTTATRSSGSSTSRTCYGPARKATKTRLPAISPTRTGRPGDDSYQRPPVAVQTGPPADGRGHRRVGVAEGIATIEDVVEAVVGDRATSSMSTAANTPSASKATGATTPTAACHCRQRARRSVSTSTGTRSKPSVGWC